MHLAQERFVALSQALGRALRIARRRVGPLRRECARPVTGSRPCGVVHVQSLVKELEGKGLAAGSVRNIYEVAARVFDAASEDRVIPSSPCRRITLPKGAGGEIVPPALAEIEDVREKLDERWKVIPLVLAGSGLRIGELLGLGVYDVDYLRREIRVERQRLQSGEIAPLKSKSSRRTVPVVRSS